jgi:hypothetical protein
MQRIIGIFEKSGMRFLEDGGTREIGGLLWTCSRTKPR